MTNNKYQEEDFEVDEIDIDQLAEKVDERLMQDFQDGELGCDEFV